MIFREEFIALLKGFEGFRGRPYTCPGEYATIGYGHVIRSDERYKSVTQQEAQTLLQKDLERTLKALERLIDVTLETHQLEALLSFTFNVGAGAFQRSTLRQRVNRQDHDQVPKELARWVFAGGRKLKGLFHRRHVEGLWYQGLMETATKEVQHESSFFAQQKISLVNC